MTTRIVYSIKIRYRGKGSYTMIIGIIADTHDNMTTLRRAVDYLNTKKYST
jgi:hypothetical protein